MNCKQRDYENWMIYNISVLTMYGTQFTHKGHINIQTTASQTGLNRKQDSCSELETET